MQRRRIQRFVFAVASVGLAGLILHGAQVMRSPRTETETVLVPVPAVPIPPQPSPGFSFEARAIEVLRERAAEVRLDPSTRLGAPEVRTGEASTQVYFRQERQGIPLAPLGNVTLDFDPDGKLSGLYSDGVASLKVVNERVLSREQAEIRARAAVPSRSVEVQGGQAVIWVMPGGDGTGHHAYDFSIEGTQIIVDAASGGTLITRNRRIH